MEIITGVARRRSWPLEQKLAVLAEASRRSESAASVARRHDIRPQQLYRWRRELREGWLDGSESEPPACGERVTGRDRARQRSHAAGRCGD